MPLQCTKCLLALPLFIIHGDSTTPRNSCHFSPPPQQRNYRNKQNASLIDQKTAHTPKQSLFPHLDRTRTPRHTAQEKERGTPLVWPSPPRSLPPSHPSLPPVYEVRVRPSVRGLKINPCHAMPRRAGHHILSSHPSSSSKGTTSPSPNAKG